MVERKGRDWTEHMYEWPMDMNNGVGIDWEWGIGREVQRGGKLGQV